MIKRFGFGFVRFMEAAGEGGDTGAVAAPVVDTSLTTQTPVVPAKGAEPVVPAAAEEGPVEYAETGNQKVDYALGIIGKAGLGMEHPAVTAAMSGDFSLLAHQLEAKGVAGAAGLVAMLEGEYKADLEAEAKEVEGIKANVLAIAGTPEHWGEVSNFIKENGTEDELNELRSMLKNPLQAKIAASYMVQLYDNAGGAKEPQTRVDAGAATALPVRGGQKPITSRAEFSQRYDELYRKYGADFESTDEYKQLAKQVLR
jgi:hypothetical protein